MDPTQRNLKTVWIVATAVLIAIFLFGLRWVFQVDPKGAPFLLFDYAVGLTMIFLPCTLPLAFVIVPLSLKKEIGRGIGIALSFALGVTITLSMYGAILGGVGQAIGAQKVEQVKNILYVVAGVLGFFFALAEIGLTKFRMPTYSGSLPKIGHIKSDYTRAALMGLFLGNVGVGCPNPLFNAVIIPQIFLTASAVQGFWIMFVQALGRVTPLLILAFLGILGMNATSFLMKYRERVEKGVGWAMVVVGSFLIVLGLGGHDWYVYSGVHSLFEKLTQEEAVTNLLGLKVEGLGHTHADVPQGPFLPWGSWLMVTLIALPLFFYVLQQKKMGTTDEVKAKIGWMKWSFIWLSLLLYVTFGYTLPQWFRHEVAGVHAMEEDHPENGEMPHGAAHEIAKEPNITMGFNIEPVPYEPGKPLTLDFAVRDKETSALVTDIEVVHERPIHLIGVREGDLEEFFHIHPLPETDGHFRVTHTFAEAGSYKLWAEARYRGQTNLIEFYPVVIGDVVPQTANPNFERIKRDAGLVASLDIAQKNVRAGGEIDFSFSVTHEATQRPLKLGMFLGENAHIEVISADLKHFHHLHASYGTMHGEGRQQNGSVEGAAMVVAHGGEERNQENQPSERGSDDHLDFSFTFPEPGLYTMFIEYVLQEELGSLEGSRSGLEVVRRFETWFTVGEKGLVETHEGGLTQEGKAPLSKPVLVVISLVAIAILLPAVSRYLEAKP